MIAKIIDIEDDAKISSRRREFTKKYLIGKHFKTIEYTWCETNLMNNDLDEYFVITGYLIKPDKTEHYFEVHGAKIEKVL